MFLLEVGRATSKKGFPVGTAHEVHIVPGTWGVWSAQVHRAAPDTKLGQRIME